MLGPNFAETLKHQNLVSKYPFYWFIVLFFFLFASVSGRSQTTIRVNDYDSLKSLGLINNTEQFNIAYETNNRQSVRYSHPDSSFILAMPPSDDMSSTAISLPFDFCFYGAAENVVFINTNGNISFDQAFSTGTPFNFPFANFKVIAPFWSDVDTRSRGGVYYKVLHNALIVNWLDVGHFDKSNQRGNSYQLIITDGTSDLLPFGNTVGFFYNKIEWTAGDASGGVNGFGGAPAFIGMNAGDGIRYSQAGKFDKNDSTFIADIDTVNGVLQLVNKHIYFNPCDSINQKPGLMGTTFQDTIGVCVGDTLQDIYYFFAPEADQETFVTVSSPNFSGFTLLNTTADQMATAEFEIVGSVSNMGFHTISFTVVDNGTPSQLIKFEVVVQVDSLPLPLNIMGDTLICEYDSTTLSVDPVYEDYLWSTGSYLDSIRVAPGNYVVTVSYHNCYAEEKFSVTANIPSAFITAPRYICLPDSFKIGTISGSDSYLWSTGDTTFETIVTANGLYTVTVMNDGCVKSDSVNIEQLTLNSVNINTTNINSCNGEMVTLSVSNDFDSVIWSDGSTQNSTKVLAGTYYVTVTLNSTFGNSCTSVDSITITNATITPVNVSGDSLICGEGSTTFNAIGIYSSYLWDNEIVSSSSTFDTGGPHWLVVTEGTCVDSVHFDIQKNPNPLVQIQGNLFYCDTVDSSRLVAVGGLWDSLLWNTGDITDTIYTGFGWKNVRVWKDGCSSLEHFPVNELINGVDVQGITKICPGQSTRLDVEHGFDLYQWNTGALGFSTLASAPGDYWCVVHLDTCYATTDTVTVTMNTPDTVQIFGDTVMCDTSGGFIYADLGYQIFNWSTGEKTPGIHYTSPGIYSVTVEDKGFCVTSDTVIIKQLAPLTVQISGDHYYCFNDSTSLSVANYDSYLWSNGDTNQSTKVREGVYSITVMNNDGCRAIENNWRVESSNPTIDIFNQQNVCDSDLGFMYSLSKGNEKITWSTGDTTDTVLVYPGSYSLNKINIHGCEVDKTHDFVGVESPTAGLYMDPENESNSYIPVGFHDDSYDNGTNIVKWYWNISDSLISSSADTIITFYSPDELTITHAVIADNGCADTVSIFYTIKSDLVKTNVISPNGDGINDYLVFPNLGKYETKELVIYNRWGVEIARFEDYYNFWDAYGVPDGVYFYTINLGDGNDPIKGSFTILR